MHELIYNLNRIANSILNTGDPEIEYVKLSKPALTKFLSLVKTLNASKGEVLVEPGKTSRDIFFISEGLARIFYYKNGKDITEAFRIEGNILHSAVSMITGRPDKRGIEIIEPSKLLYINYQAFEKNFREYSEFEQMARIFMNISIVLLQKRLDGLLFESAESRYRKLMDIHPNILTRLPLSMVASYLGITQETLSRIRSKYSLNQK